MQAERTKDEWLSILNSEIWTLRIEETGILPALKLSFDHLPSPSLKRCFSFCSMFSKDSKIDKDKLIQLWMAQGFLQPPERSKIEMEDLGSKFFDVLLVNSLVQSAPKDVYKDDIVTSYTMHDLVHDLAMFVSKSQSLTWRPNAKNVVDGIRHLSLIPMGETLPAISDDASARKMRTLFSLCKDLGDMLPKFKSVRVLNLIGAGIEGLPVSIGKLKHLRYLDVSATRIKRFPKSFAELYHLQTLRLMKCSCLEEFPKKLRKLINLRHFHIGVPDRGLMVPASHPFSSHNLLKMPVQMGQLTCLQTLGYFAVGKERGCRIEELGPLNKLRGSLVIRTLENVKDGEEAKKANLLCKIKLEELELKWDGPTDGNTDHEAVLDSLQPPPNLKVLGIFNFGGDKFPSWMMMMMPFDNLAAIKIFGCDKCEQIPMLGHLPCLREVWIEEMGSLKCIDVNFYGSVVRGLFPALKKLSLINMKELVEWKEVGLMLGGARLEVFPCLEELYLLGCGQLRSAPTHFPSLRKLEFTYFDSSKPLEDISSNLTTLSSLTIRKVFGLSFLPEGLLQNNKNLEYLEIVECHVLTHITPDVSGSCTSLRYLHIEGCDKLTALMEGLNTLISLEELIIDDCPNLKAIPSVNGLTALRRLEVKKCWGLTSLPSGLDSCKALRSLIIQQRNGGSKGIRGCEARNKS